MSAHKYELMFIADPELDERGLKKLTEQYLETVTKEGGAVENIDIWGRRKLAYEIAGFPGILRFHGPAQGTHDPSPKPISYPGCLRE